MNINAITKNYDKLTTVERFKLLNAARNRGDKTELAALRNSAPKKTWTITTTTGIVEAFEFLSSWHIMSMQETSAIFNLLLTVGDEKMKYPDGFDFYTLGDLLQARTLARDAAWREVCKEYCLDPDEIISDYPGVETINYLVAVMSAMQKNNPVEIDTAPYINDLHAVIDNKRKEWE